MINASKEVPDSIQVTLSQNGWIKDIKQGSNGVVTVFEKGTEKVIFRGFDSSSGNGAYPGWKHEQTMEVFKMFPGLPKETKIGEIKFILPI